MPHIHLKIGCMFSGKTSALWVELERHRHRGGVLAVRPACDTRGAPARITAHNGATLPAVAVARLMDAAAALLTSSAGGPVVAVAVDEGQFFPDLVEGCLAFVAAGADVYVAALNGDWLARPYATVAALLPHAHSVAVHHAFCACGAEAQYSQRTVASTNDVVIGGKEAYAAVCARCRIKVMDVSDSVYWAGERRRTVNQNVRARAPGAGAVAPAARPAHAARAAGARAAGRAAAVPRARRGRRAALGRGAARRGAARRVRSCAACSASCRAAAISKTEDARPRSIVIN
jgi:thymidine kinase